MIFNSFGFLFLFLPIVVALFFTPFLSKFRVWILLTASLLFYSISGLEHVAILLLQIFWVFLIAGYRSYPGNKPLLALAISVPAASLIYYKYTDFLINSFFPSGVVGPTSGFSLFQNVILPAGISFFTFQTISLCIDRFNGTQKQMPKLKEFALYISFFPQLVAGPIVRFPQVSEAIAGLETFHIKYKNLSAGVGYILFGLAAKVLLADPLSDYIAPLIKDPTTLSSAASVYVVFSYSFQIYFDFYGYSLIAIGLGTLFGFQLPDNFLRPYEALNPKEFWRCWHVSLSSWIRDYIYMPLGGNKRHLRNIIIIFSVVGLWHGAAWTFVVWGLYHAVLVTGYGAISNLWDRMTPFIQKTVNFTLVSLGWVLFFFNFKQAGQLYASLVGLGKGSVEAPDIEAWLFLLLAGAVCFLVHFENRAQRKYKTRFGAYLYSSLLAVLFVTILMFIDRSQDFIYFRF